MAPFPETRKQTGDNSAVSTKDKAVTGDSTKGAEQVPRSMNRSGSMPTRTCSCLPPRASQAPQ